MQDASRTARASALYGDVRKTGATAVCDPRAAAVCRRASASSDASRSARWAADSCIGSGQRLTSSSCASA